MFDLKVINSVLQELEEERGIARERMLDAISQALATAYKKEFGKRNQVVRAQFDLNTGTTTFEQIKTVVDESMLREDEEGDEELEEVEETIEEGDEPKKVRFDEEKHIMLASAKLIKKDVELGDELSFPLESKDDFGRIAAQTAKQVIVQNIREAEKESALKEFGQKEGDIVMGHVQRFERGNLYIDLGKVTGVMPYEEQIPGERYRPGERVRCLLLAVEETPRGIFIKLSRAHAEFLAALFEVEAPELQNGTVEVKAIAREAGNRSKIAVYATDPHIDPVGSMVGQRGSRVSVVMSELGGEKIDIIEWSEYATDFIEDALSPAEVLEVRVEQEPDEAAGERGHAIVEVAPDQQSLAIGRGGQNVRLAAKLTGWKIDIMSVGGQEVAESDGEEALVAATTEVGQDIADIEEADATTEDPELDMAGEAEATEDRDAYGPDEMNEIDTPEEAEEMMDAAEEAAETGEEVEDEVRDAVNEESTEDREDK